jgi:IPT/TIG domain
MKTLTTVKAAALLISITLTLACGYSSKMTPPSAGTTPTIAALSPSSASAGGMAFTLTINGSNFLSNAYVSWNGSNQAANTKFVGAGQVTLAVPASAIASSGTVQVTVTNPGTQGTGPYGGGGTLAETSNMMTFTIN